MGNKNNVRFNFLLSVYILLLLGDAWLLYKGQYGGRFVTKLVSIPMLGIWFYANTTAKAIVASNTQSIRLAVMYSLGAEWISDLLGLFYSNLIAYVSCLLIFTVIYIIYLFLFIEIQRNLSNDKKFFIYPKFAFPALLIMSIVAFVFFHKVINDWTLFYTVTVILHGIVIILLVGLVVNSFGDGVNVLKYYLLLAVLLILTANIGYGISDLIYHRKHRILDVPVALSNGVSLILIGLVVIKIVKEKEIMEVDGIDKVM